ASRQSLGTAVFGGMITSTVLAIFFVPVFYVAIQSLIELKNGPPKHPPGEELPVAAHGETPAAEKPEHVSTVEVNGAPDGDGKPEKEAKVAKEPQPRSGTEGTPEASKVP